MTWVACSSAVARTLVASSIASRTKRRRVLLGLRTNVDRRLPRRLDDAVVSSPSSAVTCCASSGGGLASRSSAAASFWVNSSSRASPSRNRLSDDLQIGAYFGRVEPTKRGGEGLVGDEFRIE